MAKSGMPARSTAPKRIRKTKRARQCGSHTPAYTAPSAMKMAVPQEGTEKGAVAAEQLYDPASSSFNISRGATLQPSQPDPHEDLNSHDSFPSRDSTLNGF